MAVMETLKIGIASYEEAEGQESAVSDTGGAPSLDLVCVLELPDWLLDGRLLRDLERAAYI